MTAVMATAAGAANARLTLMVAPRLVCPGPVSVPSLSVRESAIRHWTWVLRRPALRRTQGRSGVQSREVVRLETTRVSRSTQPSFRCISTWLGTTSTRQPAAAAEVAPVCESSIARVSPGVQPRSSAARR